MENHKDKTSMLENGFWVQELVMLEGKHYHPIALARRQYL